MKRIKDVTLLHIGNIKLCPPALSAANFLALQGYHVTVITTKDHSYDEYRNVFSDNIDIRLLDFSDPLRNPFIPKVANMLHARKVIWQLIDELYRAESSLIWVSSLVSLKYLGTSITARNYVLHVMELSERIQYTNRLRFPEMDAEKIGNAALAVIVPERTRAHITQAWWNLKSLPLVLPNKPMETGINERNQQVSDPTAARILASLKGKKIVLYQGIVHKERPLKPYLEAVELLNGRFAFVTMGSTDPLSDQESSLHAHIPYIAAPKHLEVTSNAHIGVLSYFPFKGHISVLNPLFCAPNKTFEYAKFGIPMLANDNPNLNSTFEKWGCGKTIGQFDGETIARAIKEIDEHYDEMSDASRTYYESVNMPELVAEIMQTVERRLNDGMMTGVQA